MPAKPHDTAYSKTPLAQKLGVLTTRNEPREVALIGAPADFRLLLGDLPSHIRLRQSLSPGIALAIVFTGTVAELDATLDILQSQLPPKASAWIVHPKKHHKPAFNQTDVRNRALALGLVDYKICSVDADWSGIKFAWRKSS